MLIKRTTTNYLLWAFLIIAGTTTIKTILIDADPVKWYTADIGYHIDEGYKTLSPRNLLYFGEVKWNEHDQYSGWMNTSPATQWPYYAAFKAFGPELSSPRSISVFFNLIFLVVAAWFLFSRLPANIAFIGVTVLAFDSGLFLFSRSALFETSMLLITYIAVFGAAKLPSNRHMLAVAVLFLVAIAQTLLIKASAIIYLAPPMLAIITLGVLPKLANNRRLMYAPLATIILLCVFAYITRDIWVHKLQLLYLLKTPQAFFHNPVHTLSPFALAAGYVVLLDLTLRNPAALFYDRYRLCLASIIVIVPIAFALFRYHPPRYFIPVIPAALLLIPEWLSLQFSRPLLSPQRAKKVNKYIIVISTITLFLLLTMTLHAGGEYYILRNLPFNLGEDPGLDKSMVLRLYPASLFLALLFYYFLVRKYWCRLSRASINSLIGLHLLAGILVASISLFNPSYESREIRSKITSIIEMDASIGGDWAPFFGAEVNLKTLYMRPDWNNAQHVTKIRPNYFLYSSTYYDDITRKGLMSNPFVSLAEPIELGTFIGNTLLLYPISYNDELEKPSVLH